MANIPSWPPATSQNYEMPPWPSCPTCDGRGWYSGLNLAGDLVDRRCQCWVWQLAIEGPPE